MVNEQLDVWSCGCLDAENIRYYDLVNQVYFETHGRGQSEHIYDKKHYDENHTSLIWYKVKEQSRLTALYSR